MHLLVKRIDELIEQKSLLKHPFYVDWTEGSLPIESIAGYSKEYYQLVKAVPGLVETIMQYAPEGMKEEIDSNRKEEQDHIEPWMRFASSLGIPQPELKEYSALEKTRQAVSYLERLIRSYDEGSAAMYALELEIPKVSLSKLDGLRKFYDLTSEDATEYFRLHTEADIRHAALWRNILENTTKEGEDDLFDIAQRSVAAQHLMLDSCYEAYC
ncbi:MAG: iron-containing redox enzyme family protein [Thaumarchaeota archaeon]|nr:iron-containing redox enzyme family protein [Nitrososphaerota archaeon]